MKEQLFIELDSKQNIGEIQLSIQALETIAACACFEIDGIYSINGKIDGTLSQSQITRLIKKSFTISYTEDEGIIIDLNVKMKYGTQIDKYVEKIQKSIIGAIELATDFKVKNVNVHVIGVEF